VGAAFFLIYGLSDQWWHALYGFDVTLVSPPHVGLMLALLITMIGCLAAFVQEARSAEMRDTPMVGPIVGVAAAAAILVAFVTPTTLAVITDNGPIADRIDGAGLAIGVLYPMTLLLVASSVRTPGAATLTALLFTVLRLALTPIIPWITSEYAASIGLALRDFASALAIVPGLMPTYLLVAGVAVDALLAAGRRLNWDLRLVAPLAGAVVALLLRLLEPTLPAFMPEPTWPPEVIANELATIAWTKLPTLAVMPFVGALAGWLGWLIGIVLHDQGEPSVNAEHVSNVARA
jgi:hypothetical protein